MLLRDVESPDENYRPPKEFLLGVGQPFEPERWEYWTLLMATY